MAAPMLTLPTGGATIPTRCSTRTPTWTAGQGFELYPAQAEALIELVSGSSVILSTPTGSGKSLVATGVHFVGLATGKRSVYTAPIKALVSEKFFTLCDVFGADQVGMLTGDASVNATAPVICCTAEVLANIALREGAAADADIVILDEFHYYGDVDRGWAWQVPLLELNRAQFLLMSATLGDVSALADDLTRRTGARRRWSRRWSGRCRWSTGTRRHRCTRRSPTCSAAGRPRSTSCTSPRPAPSRPPRR